MSENPALQVSVAAGSNPGTGNQNFGMMQTNTKYQDVRVRRAVSMSYDRAKVSQRSVYEGIATFNLDMPWWDLFETQPQIQDLGPWVKFDPAQARQLLSAAGQDNLVMDASYYPYSPTATSVNDILTDDMRQSGISYNVKALHDNSFNSQWTSGKMEDAVAFAWYPDSFTADEVFYGHWHLILQTTVCISTTDRLTPGQKHRVLS